MKPARHTKLTPELLAIEADIRSRIKPLTPFLIGIDGRDGAGKSSTARYLAWALGISCVETDLFTKITPNSDAPNGHQMLVSAGLKPVVMQGLQQKRPIIVEGIVLLKKLELMGLPADYLVYVRQDGNAGDERLRAWLDQYRAAYSPKDKADHTYNITPPPLRFKVTTHPK